MGKFQIQELGRQVSDEPPHALARLRAAGFEAEEASDIIRQAAEAFDRAGKGFGQHSGPLGNAGCAAYARLFHGEAFDTYTPFRTADVAKAMRLSRNTVHQALQRLSVHGFLTQEKQGYSFSYKLSLPDAAMHALGSYLDFPDFNEDARDLSARIRAVFPSPTA